MNRPCPVFLCQPDRFKSCAACCGLYNWHNHSRRAIQEIVTLQTDLFLSREGYEQLDRYRTERSRHIRNTKLFDTIYNCEFAGFIDKEHRRIGCMLHPEVTGREELRDHCFYGSKICSEHFCPSYGCLTTTEQNAVIAGLDDWYLYGLIITDIDLVKEFFKHVQETLGETVKESRLCRPGVSEALACFFTLKEHWKFKAGENRLGKYYFSEAEYHIARIDYLERWGLPPSRYDKILVSLESDLDTKDDLLKAEGIIDDRIKQFVRAYEL